MAIVQRIFVDVKVHTTMSDGTVYEKRVICDAGPDEVNTLSETVSKWLTESISLKADSRS